jgi:hypothetical protein
MAAIMGVVEPRGIDIECAMVTVVGGAPHGPACFFLDAEPFSCAEHRSFGAAALAMKAVLPIAPGSTLEHPPVRRYPLKLSNFGS